MRNIEQHMNYHIPKFDNSSRILKKYVVDYEHSIAAESRNNHKAFYIYVNSKLKSKDPVRHLLKRDGTLTTTDKEKADVLNEQFSSVFTKENMLNFPDITSHQLRTEPLTTLHITRDTVYNKLSALHTDKSPGPDGIHPRLLKETAHVIISPLSIIFNKSINEGFVPEEWKRFLRE